jgi:hypothetical protein
MKLAREEKIRQRAYGFWENEGRLHGRDQEHWLRAEAEILTSERQGRVLLLLPPSSMNANPPANKKATSRKARKR